MNFNKYRVISKIVDVDFNKLKLRKSLKRLLINKPKSLGKSNGSIVS